MKTIKFDDFMKGNYKNNQLNGVWEVVFEKLVEILVYTGIGVFGLIFLDQFLEVMLQHIPTVENVLPIYQ